MRKSVASVRYARRIGWGNTTRPVRCSSRQCDLALERVISRKSTPPQASIIFSTEGSIESSNDTTSKQVVVHRHSQYLFTIEVTERSQRCSKTIAFAVVRFQPRHIRKA